MKKSEALLIASSARQYPAGHGWNWSSQNNNGIFSLVEESSEEELRQYG